MQGSASVVRRGFTLIELLIVVVIIGILAAIAIPKFNLTKGRSYASSMRSDLRNVASQQEDFFYTNDRYASDVAELNFTGSPGVEITIVDASSGGWSATATHPVADPLTCAVYYGSAAPLAPAVAEGQVACD
jgi:prepilin-type N-terminal cleavage/methylation domain-containing protein